MRVLVIGGTGFIGSFVVRQLTDMGHEVTVFHRGTTTADLPTTVRHIAGDHSKLSESAHEFRRLAPDVVLDMILGTRRRTEDLMSIIRGTTHRVIAASSIDVYRAYGKVRGFEPGPPDPVPLAEDSPLRERLRPHSATEIERMSQIFSWFEEEYEKIEVERVIMGDPDLPGTILRLPAVYGPGDPLHRLFPDLKRMDDRRPAILIQDNLARWRWSRGYVENVAAAIVLVVVDDRAAGRIYNVAEPHALSHAEWVREIGKAAGWEGEIVILPKEELPDHLRNPLDSDQDWVVDTTRIRKELGYTESVHRDEALRRTIEWERANPPRSIDPGRFNYAAEDNVLARL